MDNLFEIEYEKLYVQTILFEMKSIDKTILLEMKLHDLYRIRYRSSSL